MIEPNWTGMGNTDATNNAPCPKCGAKAGERCAMPSGRRANEPHTERLIEFRKLYPNYTANRKVGMTGAQFMAKLRGE